MQNIPDIWQEKRLPILLHRQKKEKSMKKEVNPTETSRAQAYELWMKAPNPMVTFFKTIDVTRTPDVEKYARS